MTYEEALALPLLPMGSKTLGNATPDDWVASGRYRIEEGERIAAMSVEEFMEDREHYDALFAYFDQLDEAMEAIKERSPELRKWLEAAKAERQRNEGK